MQMDSTHMKKFSMSLVISKMKIKAQMNPYILLVGVLYLITQQPYLQIVSVSQVYYLKNTTGWILTTIEMYYFTVWQPQVWSQDFSRVAVPPKTVGAFPSFPLPAVVVFRNSSVRLPSLSPSSWFFPLYQKSSSTFLV